VLRAAQWIAAALVLYFVGRAIAGQWATFKSTPLAADVHWWPIVVSSVLVLAVYALLVQTWRVLLAESGESLTFLGAARIWSISNLWRYVPGKVWSIAAMSELARRQNVGPAIAAGSSILSTLLNIATGLALMLLLGWRWLELIAPNARAIAVALIALAALGLLALPFTLSRVAAYAARVTGRDLRIDAPPARAIALAIAGNLAAWIAYGIAFMWMVRGVIGAAPGATWQYVAVYTASYVVGYLFLFLPGGIGPREAVMFALLPALHMATPKQALLIAAASRVWLTILEVVPGLVFLAVGKGLGSPRPSPPRPE
jgi:glycosyltransferase 2 family protein